MGGYTFRRTTLVALIWLVFATIPIPNTGATEPLQSHVGPALYSIYESGPFDEAVERLRAELKPGVGPALRRMQPYRTEIDALLAARGLSTEILAVAVIESHFQVGAVSSSGAVGVWQFMDHSVPNWMRMREDIDDRRDVFFSTLAALDKLIHNYNTLGDWWAAITAYNGGLGLVSRAMEAAAGDTPRERFLAAYDGLPPEPKRYILKFLAAAPLVAYPGRHGIDMEWNEPVEWDFLVLDEPVDIVLLAERAGVPVELMLEANAASSATVTPLRGHVLRFPKSKGESVRRLVAAGEHLLHLRPVFPPPGMSLSELSDRLHVPEEIIVYVAEHAGGGNAGAAVENGRSEVAFPSAGPALIPEYRPNPLLWGNKDD